LINLAFKNRDLNLGEGFCKQCNPTPVAKPALIRFFDGLAIYM
jgi:hypothetical protein